MAKYIKQNQINEKWIIKKIRKNFFLSLIYELESELSSYKNSIFILVGHKLINYEKAHF